MTQDYKKIKLNTNKQIVNIIEMKIFRQFTKINNNTKL